jgi:hypothetical protein
MTGPYQSPVVLSGLQVYPLAHPSLASWGPENPNTDILQAGTGVVCLKHTSVYGP